MRQNTKKKAIRTFIRLLILLVGMFFFSGLSEMEALAGEINDEESRIIAASKGTFEYEGKTYRAYSNYINRLYAYLSRDDIDLNEGQANKVISYMYSNVKRGLDEGYIYEVKETTENPTSEQDTSVTEENTGEPDTEEITGSEENTETPSGQTEDTSRGTEKETEERSSTEEKTESRTSGTEAKTEKKTTERRTTEQKPVIDPFVPGIIDIPGDTEEDTEEKTEQVTGENGSEDPSSSEEPKTEDPEGKRTDPTEEPGRSTESKTEERSTERSTEKEPAAPVDPKDPSGNDPTDPVDIDLDKIFDEIGEGTKNAQNLEKRVKPEDADASAVISEETIVIDTGDGDPIELDSEKQIVPTAWTTTVIVSAAVTLGIAVAACLVLIVTGCMRFRKSDRKKVLPGHRRRRRIRKICRRILMVTTGISVTGLFLLSGIFISLFNKGRMEQSIQESGYFRYAYIEYLSEHGRSVEGAEYLSDEETEILSKGQGVKTGESGSGEKILSYEEFLIKEKQATEMLLDGYPNVSHQKSNVAPYILRLKEDIRFSMILSLSLFVLALGLGCVFTTFMDLRRDRGVRMIAVSELIGVAAAIATTVFLYIWAPASRLFIEPDFLYLFFKNYMEWIGRIFVVISVFGLVLGMTLVGLYHSRRKGRNH